MLRVGVALESESAEALVVAAAKLYTFELHEIQRVAKAQCRSFDPTLDESECVFDRYELVERELVGGLYFVGVVACTVGLVDAHRRAMGAWGAEIAVVSVRATTLLTREDLDLDDLAAFADMLCLNLPSDAAKRLRDLIHKHIPSPHVHRVASPKRQREDETELLV